MEEEDGIQDVCDEFDGRRAGSQGIGDVEAYPHHIFVNMATDLLKYVHFLAAVKDYMTPMKWPGGVQPKIKLGLYFDTEDTDILAMYPEIVQWEGVDFYTYRSEKDAADD